MALLITSLLSVAPPNLAAAAASAEMKAYTGTVVIPTYPWWPAVRHPYFRATDGRNIYPYPMLDQLVRTKVDRTYRTVVLENEYLRATFLPEIGGRVYEVIDKTTSQPMFYVNHVLKPGLIGQCGAWVSGGIEFNTGPAGHTVSAVMPVDVEILPPAPDGSRSVAVGEVERIYRTRWTAVVTLRPGRSFLEETIRIDNRTETVRPYYFWNCTAVPNPSGFRFIYPMTLGTDHGGNVFYTWPISDGKDLSLGRSYEDASSIFAYQCDQDFFGSYDPDADRGVVAYANHHQLPGKKAWTWGHGSYGTMHQMDLTDEDGPYNEVQTGPLPTQADVGRMLPGEVVRWQEWWYPVHGLGGFSFANRDLAVNTLTNVDGLQLRFLGTGTWDPINVEARRGTQVLATATARLSPSVPANLTLPIKDMAGPLTVDIRAGKTNLAHFRVPLDLPVRTPPSKPTSPETASEWVEAGWQDFLFARFPEAETKFRQALDKDAKAKGALAGLAFVNLDRNPGDAVTRAKAALAVDPEYGLAWYVLAVAELRQILADPVPAQAPEKSSRDASSVEREKILNAALDHAWKACRDASIDVPARALVGKILIRQQNWPAAMEALGAPGPWQRDSTVRNRLALVRWLTGSSQTANQLARQSIADDPLDAFARSIVGVAGGQVEGFSFRPLIEGKPQSVLELAAEYFELGQDKMALRALEEFGWRNVSEENRHPLVGYWAAYLSDRMGKRDAAEDYLSATRRLSVEGVFPHRYETVPVLRWALQKDPQDGGAALLLGHLLFSLGRLEEGRSMWQRAADLKVAPAVAYRALGLACRKLDGDTKQATELIRRGHQADPADPILAMDLAQVMFSQADQASGTAKAEMIRQVRDILRPAFENGKGRSDYVALLARAYSRLGEYAETAQLLDSVRITIWEGAREAHDLFEEAHVALGKTQLESGHPAEALKEFDRALEYPANLATGRMQEAREAHIQYLRGQALMALDRKTDAMAAWKKAADERSSRDPKKEEARKLAKEALGKLEAQ